MLDVVIVVFHFVEDTLAGLLVDRDELEQQTDLLVELEHALLELLAQEGLRNPLLHHVCV